MESFIFDFLIIRDCATYTTPAYYGEFMRLILLAGGAFWIFASLLIWLLGGDY